MGDPVDDIRDGWARVRPDLPTRSVGVVSLIWRLSQILRAERAAVLVGLGIDQATLELLANLRRSPKGTLMTPGVLAQRCGVTPGAISLRLRRAEQSGWVTRQTTTADARSVHVQLTTAGREAADEFAQLVLEHDETLVSDMSDRDLDDLEHLLRALTRSVTARNQAKFSRAFTPSAVHARPADPVVPSDMADLTPGPVSDRDPISGLPSVTVGHPVTAEEVADALDEEANERAGSASVDGTNAGEAAQTAVSASRHVREAGDDDR